MLGSGIFIALFLTSKIIGVLLKNYAPITFAFFFGLISASALMLWKKSGALNMEKAVLLALGFVAAYVLAGASALAVSHSLPTVFISSMFAIAAMILPGISGAFILLLLNQYEFLINALHTYNLVVLATAAFGALVGLAAFSHIIAALLRKFRKLTFSFLIGLMVGSLRIPINHISGNLTLLVIFSGLFGFMIVFLLEEFLGKDLKKI